MDASDDPVLTAPADLLRAIGHPLRIAILNVIRAEERSVGDIEAETAITQPGLSQHLGVLRKAGLVDTRRESKHVFYRPNRERLKALSGVLASLADGAVPAEPAAGLKDRVPVTPASRMKSAAAFARIG